MSTVYEVNWRKYRDLPSVVTSVDTFKGEGGLAKAINRYNEILLNDPDEIGSFGVSLEKVSDKQVSPPRFERIDLKLSQKDRDARDRYLRKYPTGKV